MSKTDTSTLGLGAIRPAAEGVAPRARSRRRQFERLAAGLRPDLYRYAFWLGRDPAVAEDVVQEALLRAWRAFDGLREPAAMKPWLLAIVRREHARFHQRKRPETASIDALTGSEELLLASTDDPALRDVRRAMLELEDAYREPLVLQVLMGYRTDEIARMMGMTRQNVLTRLHRARRKLKRALDPASEASEG